MSALTVKGCKAGYIKSLVKVLTVLGLGFGCQDAVLGIRTLDLDLRIFHRRLRTNMGNNRKNKWNGEGTKENSLGFCL